MSVPALSLLLLLLVICLPGCANVIANSAKDEVVAGAPEIERGETDYTLAFGADERGSAVELRAPISGFEIPLSAVAIEHTTITTPRFQRSTRDVIEYSGLRELAEWPIMMLVGWVGVLERTHGFGTWIDGINPFVNSDTFKPEITTQTLSEAPIRPTVEERTDASRIEGARIALRFPGLPAVEMVSTDDAALRIPLDRLITGHLDSAPSVVEGRVLFRGRPEPVTKRVELAPEVSARLFRASRQVAEMDAEDPAEVARVALEIEALGFARLAQEVERTGVAQHGETAFRRAVADAHVTRARAAHLREDRQAALAALQLARAQVTRSPRDWDLLEADIHESSGLQAIERQDYDQARDDLLKASRLDRERQARLASFVAISIEAMDRETARDAQATLSASPSYAAPTAVSDSATPPASAVSDLVEQCLAREAALQACRVMPGFGKDICKSGVRANYSNISCP